jgi:hypothetical protein
MISLTPVVGRSEQAKSQEDLGFPLTRSRAITAITRSELVFFEKLRLQITGFPAGWAVILAVFAQADFVLALAEPAVFIARATVFRQFADDT